MADTDSDLEKMYRTFTAPDAPQADAPDDDADEGDVLFAGDLTTKEFAELLNTAIAREISRLQREIAAQMNAPKVTTKAKAKPKGITFKG